MKKFTLLVILVTSFQFVVMSQNCLPDGIDFTTQIQIDSFPTNYPNCTRIIGDVDIHGDDISNLDSLISVTSYGALLDIRYNPILSSLDGLSNVTTISALRISGDNELTDLTGLENLDSLNWGLTIWNTNILSSLNGLNGVSIIGGINIRFNEVLSDLTALSNIGPTVADIEISDNDSLSSLSGLENINSVIGSVFIVNCPTINDINALENIDSIGSSLSLFETSLTDCLGLSSLAYVGGDVWIEWNDELIDFSGLENLNVIGDLLRISNNNNLTSLTGLDNLDSINGQLYITGNEMLADISGLDNLNTESIDDLSIRWNPLLSECAINSICNYLSSPNGEIEIESNNTGCNSQEEVEEACLTGENTQTVKESEISIYPNPFSTKATFSYTLQQPSTVNITIFNHLGQEVEVIQQNQSSGTQQIIWNAEGQSSGVYYYRMQSGNQFVSGKMMLVRK